MLRYFLIPVLLLVACLAAAPAYAGCSNPTGNEADRIYNSDYQTLQFCNGTNWVPFGAYQAYVGPGDIVSGVTAWYGLRAYSAAVAATGTQKAINIRRASDNTTKDILIRKSGNLDTPTASTFCASTTCYVTKWYDQSGNGNNVVQPTTTYQPQLVFNCIGSLPCISFVRGSSQYLAVTASSNGQPNSVSAVAVRTGYTTSQQTIISGSTSTEELLYFRSIANVVNIFAGNSNSVTANDNAWHAFQGVFNGVSSYLNVDGTDNSISAGNQVWNQTIYLGADVNGDYLQGSLGEAGVWLGTTFSSTNRSALCHNQYTYWGTSTAC